MTEREDWRSDPTACIEAACILEVLAPKVGNVSPVTPFDDLSMDHFFRAASAIAPPLGQADRIGIGRSIHEAVVAMKRAAGTNTHLGTILLLAPLAAASEMTTGGIDAALGRLTEDDAVAVYEAIRLAAPGGLGRSRKYDVDSEVPQDLLAAMREAAERDLIARQYASGFADILDFVVPRLGRREIPVIPRIVRTHVEMIARFGDTLILRKCGFPVMEEARSRAREVVRAYESGCDVDRRLAELDHWLRSDGHRRNPGATADLIAAGLFVTLRSGGI